jgi:hypothetical protein
VEAVAETAAAEARTSSRRKGSPVPMSLKEAIKKRLEESRIARQPRLIAYDGGSGMILEFDGKIYYRDLQGRYYHAYDREGRFYEGAIERWEDIWYVLEGLPEVQAEVRRLAECHIERMRRDKRAPQPEKPFLP